jgi:protein SSD1
MGQFGSLGTFGLGLDGQPQGVPRGHGRRHSVNVVKTPGGQGSVSYGNAYAGQEGLKMVLPLQLLSADILVRPLVLIPVGASVSFLFRVIFLLSYSMNHVDGGVGGVQGNGNICCRPCSSSSAASESPAVPCSCRWTPPQMPSFSFPNMLPNMMAANMMGLGLGRHESFAAAAATVSVSVTAAVESAATQVTCLLHIFPKLPCHLFSQQANSWSAFCV